jgi:hypothetical protein
MTVDQLKTNLSRARKFGTPLIGIETPDMAATMQLSVSAMTNGVTPPFFAWDIVGGMRYLNKEAEQAIGQLNMNGAALVDATINATEMLAFCLKLPQKAVVFMLNAHLFYRQESVTQAVWNLRDPFKGTGRTLILLGAAMQLPAELERDVLVFDEPLPDDAALGKIADDLYALIGTTTKFPKTMRDKTVKAARGLSAFAAEQAIALSLTKQGIDTDQLWEHKRKMVEQTKGLRVQTGGETFADIGGLESIKEFGRLLFAGNEPPSAIVWVDEIEKAMAGSSGSVGDSSGTSQDQLGQLLQEMQANKWPGMILPGPPGTAKSLFAQALAAEHDVPCIALDLGAMKGSLVGQSEQQIRAALKVIRAVAGKGAYWIATCNRMESLPPELRRRFTDGIRFFDLPCEDERASIWKIMRKKYSIKETDTQPDDRDWTGADIRNTCALAYRLKIGLKKAATYITPVAKSDPHSIERLRKLAHNAFLSASHEGLYQSPSQEIATGRTIGGL